MKLYYYALPYIKQHVWLHHCSSLTRFRVFLDKIMEIRDFFIVHMLIQCMHISQRTKLSLLFIIQIIKKKHNQMACYGILDYYIYVITEYRIYKDFIY